MENRVKKPDWLKIKLGENSSFTQTKRILDANGMHTICSSGRCPNLGECWSAGTATFMIGGDICTRSCKFCNTKTGKPFQLDSEEPLKVADSVKKMNLRYAVITSVDRDDLPDQGANHWAETIRAIKTTTPDTTIELLIPDFQGNTTLLDVVLAAEPNVVGHNMETVRRLTPTVRSAAKYDVSLAMLQHIAKSGFEAKTGIMLGLGETEEEILETLQDIYNHGCKRLTMGQYLQPTKKHLPVAEYIHPDKFAFYKQKALEIGFLHVESGPLVRSSYHAAKQ